MHAHNIADNQTQAGRDLEVIQASGRGTSCPPGASPCMHNCKARARPRAEEGLKFYQCVPVLQFRGRGRQLRGRHDLPRNVVILKPDGSSTLATTVTYASSWVVTSVTGPNGANGTTTYDSYGRPTSTKIPDGASTGYSYAYYGVGGATANTQTATIGTRWKKTTLDGFGRTIKVETGHDSTTVSQVDTQYAACACSPLGKLWRRPVAFHPWQPVRGTSPDQQSSRMRRAGPRCGRLTPMMEAGGR